MKTYLQAPVPHIKPLCREKAGAVLTKARGRGLAAGAVGEQSQCQDPWPPLSVTEGTCQRVKDPAILVRMHAKPHGHTAKGKEKNK